MLRVAPAMAPFIAVIFLEAFCASSFYRLGPVRVNDIGGDAAMLVWRVHRTGSSTSLSIVS
jgi:hypothetical protein